MSVTKTYNFEDGTGLVFDSDLIEVLDGIRLKLQDNPGQDFTEDFADDTGFTYDSDLAEFSGGQVQQKDQRPYSNASFEASYSSIIDGTRGLGVLTGTPINGATITGSKLDLTGGRCVNYDADLNADSQQTLCIKFKAIPNFTGAPPTDYPLITICKANGDSDNIVMIRLQSNGQLQIFIQDLTGSVIINSLQGVWNNVAGIEYEFGLNVDITTGVTRLFVENKVSGNCEQFGTTQTGTGVRDSSISFLNVGGNYNNLQYWDGYISDLVIFDSVQDTTDYIAGEYSVPDYLYAINNVILPEMEYIGPGALVTFDSFTTTEAGTPRYSLQVGRSGNYLYWNGSAWAISDGTYSQANDKTTFNANLASLDIEGEIYGQFKIHFDNSNTQSSIDELTASLTAQIYPLTNPSAYISDATSLEELLDFILTITKTGSDEVKIILYKGSIAYYHNGVDWVVSDETYSQSNTLTEVQTNKATFTTTQINMYVRLFLHSETGITTPEAGPLQIVYDFAGVIDTIHKTIVYGYQLDADGNADTTDIVVYLNLDLVEYKNVTQITGDNISATPRSDGYWEMELVDTDNMEGTPYYFFRLKDKIFKKYVTEVDYISFNSLTDV